LSSNKFKLSLLSPVNVDFNEKPTKKLNIEFVEHMGYYIPKSDVGGFVHETNGSPGNR